MKRSLRSPHPEGLKIKERSLGPPWVALGCGRCSPRRACRLRGTAPMGVAGAPSVRACRCVLCRAALQCRAPRCCVAVAQSRTNAIVLCCAVLVCCAVLCCAVCTCAAFKVSHVPYPTPSVSTRSASSTRCALRFVPCSTVSTVGLPPRCSWHQEMPCLITWCATGPSRAGEGLDGRSTGGTQTPTMKISPQ